MNIIEKHSNKKFILTLFIIVTLVQLITCFNYSFEKIKHTHQFTGYQYLNNTDQQNISSFNKLFYWFYPSKYNKEDSPIVIWLSGGPGCASEIALFFENGPFKVDPNLNLYQNKFSWNQLANIIYIDQPIGTGFSPGNDYVTTEQQVAQDLFEFFVNFLQTYPTYKHRKLYIFGESYAGHYIPPTAKLFFEKQQELEITFAGIGLGDAFVDPYQQFGSFPEYSLQNQIINETQYLYYQKNFNFCQEAIKNNSDLAYWACEGSVNDIAFTNSTTFNVYNYKTKCVANTSNCYDFSNITNYLNQQKIQQQIGANNITWTPCSLNPNNALQADFFINYQSQIEYLLNNNVSVLIYHGTDDFVCNWIGGLAWVKNLTWTYSPEFLSTNFKTLFDIFHDYAYGEEKSFENLHFVKIFNAGHMAPHDQPKYTQIMFNKFIQNDNIDLQKILIDQFKKRQLDMDNI